MNLLKYLIPVLIVLITFSCSDKSGEKKPEAVSSDQLANQIEKSLPGNGAGQAHPGKAVYDQYCMACHQADGSGVPGMHPPLSAGSWANKGKKEIIGIVLNGLSGKIEVDGEIYNNLMPSHAHLTDRQIADVLSYIRSHFGNQADAITADEVKHERK